MFFFFNDTATTEIYTLSLHDALPISLNARSVRRVDNRSLPICAIMASELARNGLREMSSFHALSTGNTCIAATIASARSEEHTSELQSQSNLVCRLLLVHPNVTASAL